jgi:hypothetical protein
MSEHYAVSISISQGAFDATANASLLYADEHTETMLTLRWPTMPPQTSPENAGEWLFHCLEDLVTNFDAHEVLAAETGPRGARKGAQSA